MAKTIKTDTLFSSALSKEEKELYDYLKIISYNYSKKQNHLSSILSFTQSVNSLEGLGEGLTTLFNKNLLNDFLLEIEKSSPYVVMNLIYALSLPGLTHSINLSPQIKKSIIDYPKGKNWENDFFALQLSIINHLLHLLNEGEFLTHPQKRIKGFIKNIRLEVKNFIELDFIPAIKAHNKDILISSTNPSITKKKETLLGFILSREILYKHMPKQFVSELIEQCNPQKVTYAFIKLSHVCQGVFYSNIEYKIQHLNLMAKSVNLNKKELYTFYSMVLNKDKISKSTRYLLDLVARNHNYTGFVDMSLSVMSYHMIPYINTNFLVEFLQAQTDKDVEVKQKKLYKEIKKIMPRASYLSNSEVLRAAMNNFEINEEKKQLTNTLKKLSKNTSHKSILKI